MSKKKINHKSTNAKIVGKSREYNIGTHQLFIDFKAAYDSVDQKAFLSAMQEFNLTTHLIELVEETIKIKGNIS